MHQRIDILMAVYNNADYLLPQLESLMKQTYSDFRLIIRDDCSSDHSAELIDKFREQYLEKIVLIKGVKNLGARGNFAALIHHAEADYVMFCDADDIWLPTKIQETFALMQKNEALYGKNTPLLVHTDLTVVDKHLKVLDASFWEFSKINPRFAYSMNKLLVQNVVTGCTMLINRPLLQLAAPIPQEAIMHDWWIGLVASIFGKIDCLPKSTILYRQHGKNDTGAKNWKSPATYWAYVKKAIRQTGRQELRDRLLKTTLQALKFFDDYQGSLSTKEKKIIQNYAALFTEGPLRKRYLFLKYRYFKNSFAKNIGMFLLL